MASEIVVGFSSDLIEHIDVEANISIINGMRLLLPA